MLAQLLVATVKHMFTAVISGYIQTHVYSSN